MKKGNFRLTCVAQKTSLLKLPNIPRRSGLQNFLTTLYFAITTEATKSLTVGSY